MRIYDIIKKKRDGKSLNFEEINFFIQGYSNNEIPDYQISSLLMAIFLNKMNDEETLYLTKAMVDSGEYVDLSSVTGIKVDKHSTGGVGDSITLIIGPMVASCGIPFIKMSGRGLGHTGGTLDKLESIKGFNVNLSIDDFTKIANTIGIALCSQTSNIAPADKKIYALRDVTATVENLSLIASSIMSKKLAIGSDAIVLDVKYGSGAFMKEIDDARLLAQKMVKIGNDYGRKTVALITNMDEPLGYAVGNALEVKEAVKTLLGEGPKDLLEISLAVGSQLLLLSGKVKTEDEAIELLYDSIRSGNAYRKLLELVKYQGGDISVIENLDFLPQSKYIIEVNSPIQGFVHFINAEEIGECALHLGAGRLNLSSKIDLSAGLVLNKKVGDYVEENEVLVYIHGNNLADIDFVHKKILEIYKIKGNPVQKNKLIEDLIV